MKHLIIWLSAGRAFCTRNINNTINLLIWIIVSLMVGRVLSTLNPGTLNAILLTLSFLVIGAAVAARLYINVLLTRKRT